MHRIRIAVVVLSVVLLPSVALAHAAYKDSDPKDEATVSSSPSSVWAEYTEPLQEGSSLAVYDPCGIRVDGGNTAITGYRMEVSMAGEMAGTYSVRWVAASAIDPHKTQGTFTFSVTDGDSCDVQAAAADSETDERRAQRARSTGASATTVRGGPADDGSVRGPRARAQRAGRNNARSDTGRQPASATADSDDGFVAAQGTGGADEGGIWDGIPWDSFAIALAIAAAIGAAGGRIYANIMGPRR